MNKDKMCSLLDIAKDELEKTYNLQKKSSKDIWKGSKFEKVEELKANNVGEWGETTLMSYLVTLGIKCSINGKKTRGKCYDGKIMDIPIEIKTARQGKSKNFQHELGETPWKTAKKMVFLDICPNGIFLTIFNNLSQKEYEDGNNFECFDKKIIRRKGEGNFKFDTSITINKKCANTIFIDEKTTVENLKQFINRFFKKDK